jgi:hypothetical protein
MQFLFPGVLWGLLAVSIPLIVHLFNFRKTKKINLDWLIELYKAYPNKADFFNYKLSKQMGNFDKLAGISSVREMIIAGKSVQEIRAAKHT